LPKSVRQFERFAPRWLRVIVVDEGSISVRFARSHRLHKIDDLATKLWVGNLHESRDQLSPFGAVHEIRGVVGAGWLGETHSGHRIHRRSFEEKVDLNAKYLGRVLQPACANTICALFVFLNLLERNPKCRSQSTLAHTDEHTPHSQSRTNVVVYRIRYLLHFKMPNVKFREP
jgi:hypothetical protein